MRLGTQRVKSLRTLESSIGFVRARVAQLAEQGTLNPKVQGSTPCASTICVSGRAPKGQDVPFDAGRCHQMGVGRLDNTAAFTALNASYVVKWRRTPEVRRLVGSFVALSLADAPELALIWPFIRCPA